MEENFETSYYTWHFNMLMYLGAWSLTTKDPLKRTLYGAYSLILLNIGCFFIFTGVMDFFDAMQTDDMVRKISWNLCIWTIGGSTLVKNMQILLKIDQVNEIRKNLFRKMSSCKDFEEVEISVRWLKYYKLLSKGFYGALGVCYPFFVLSVYVSYLRGSMELLLPARWPGDPDLSDPWIYFSIFISHIAISFFMLLDILEIDVSFFGILIQMAREYDFLLKRIRDFCDWHEEYYNRSIAEENCLKGGEKEFREKLRTYRTEKKLKEIIIRQIELIKYTEEIESVYNSPMLNQIFIGGFLVVVSAIQILFVSYDFNLRMTYMIGYVIMILIDILWLCWCTNRLSTTCFEVGTAAYGIPWYNMDLTLQKNVLLMILRAQSPPRLTSGKLMELNLSTFMSMMRNVYSWLALFQPLFTREVSAAAAAATAEQ